MSEGVGTQDERAMQVSTAATEMSSTIIEIAKNASQIAASTNDTFKLAKDGSEIVENAVAEVKELACYVTTRPGGQGAVRDAVEHLLKREGQWAAAVKAIGADR